MQEKDAIFAFQHFPR